MNTIAHESPVPARDRMSEMLYVEDFVVGQKYRSARLAVDAAAIKAFAGAFDPQPFHLDEEAAGASFFGGLAASGWHTAALTTRLLVQSGLRPAGGIIGAGVDELKWPRPLRPGDDLRRTFISLARSDGADKDILRRGTHGRDGDLMDGYSEIEWRKLCEEVRRSRSFGSSAGRARGSSSLLQRLLQSTGLSRNR